MDNDWDQVTVIRKTGTNAKTVKSKSELNAAHRAGAIVDSSKKITGGTNKVATGDHQHLAKVDREDDIIAPPKLSLSVGKAIQQARQAKSWTQKDLAAKVNEKSNVINDYEMTRAIPNQQVLAKLERALGVKLRGKNIGEALGGKKAE
jgi:putative transcription factor